MQSPSVSGAAKGLPEEGEGCQKLLVTGHFLVGALG